MPASKKRKTAIKIVTNTPADKWYPVLPMRDTVIFPSVVSPFFVGRKKSLAATEAAMKTDKLVFTVTQTAPEHNDYKESQLYKVGVMGKIVRYTTLPNANIKVLFEGMERAKITNFLDDGNACFAQLKLLPLMKKSALTKEDAVYIKLIKTQVKIFLQKNNTLLDSGMSTLLDTDIDPENLCNLIAPILKMSIAEKQQLLEIDYLNEKLRKIYAALVLEDESQKIENKLRVKISKQISKLQKEYFLNEQMRAIQKELGNEEQKNEFQELEQKITNAAMSKEAEKTALAELKKLQQSSSISSEANVIRNYLDWLINVPWQQKTQDNLNIQHAKEILDKEHYGLDEVKDFILELIAVSKRKGHLKSPVLCLVGPPGVGKTSLARSVANALGRNFSRMSLGGVRDEAEIRGHRRTYVGAMPGKIIHAIKKANSRNPLILLDEVDKIYHSNMGDPAAALLEALDREQNHSFMDHYLEVEYDLSKVLFFCTANTVHSIPHPLRDRMEIVHLTGYTEAEKYQIFNEYLLPKQLKEHGLTKRMLGIAKPIVMQMIRSYTRESGIRELERILAKVLRKANRELLLDENVKSIKLTKNRLQEYLGSEKNHWGKKESLPLIGMVNGLAWSSVGGGDLLTIEVLEMPGTGKTIVTGKLGDVMKESVQAAYSFVRSNAKKMGIEASTFRKVDLHIHAPEGAVPKDGPSAGVAIATALVSALTKKPVKNNLAMTGEITLRGRILPIGGLKEKILAACRANIGVVFIPEANADNLKMLEKQIPDEISKIEITTYANLLDLIKAALAAPLAQPRERSKKEEQISPLLPPIIGGGESVERSPDSY